MAKRCPILWLEETDSTQNVFLGHIPEYDNMSVAAAKLQTAGRGQRGNRWLADKGENLTFSMLLKFGEDSLPILKATDQFMITVAATLGVVSYLDSCGIESTIKWPNDIYVRNRKVCGMLIENQLDGQYIASSVIGIGLNVNQKVFPSSLPNPTSMSFQTGKTYILEEELETLRNHLCKSFMANLTDEGAFVEYESRLYRKDVFHEYVRCTDGSSFEGMIVGVDRYGILLIDNRKGERFRFAFKEISYII